MAGRLTKISYLTAWFPHRTQRPATREASIHDGLMMAQPPRASAKRTLSVRGGFASSVVAWVEIKFQAPHVEVHKDFHTGRRLGDEVRRARGQHPLEFREEFVVGCGGRRRGARRGDGV